MRIEVSDEEINSIKQAVLKRYGIDFTCYEPSSLHRRIQRSLSVFKCGSIAELWVRILKEPEFIQRWVNELTVGMTSLFRDPQAWKKIKSIIPSVLEEKKEINIWHAGCSTGEEVHTLGIILNELNVYQKAHVLATDLNVDALETAKQGKYHMLKLNEFTKNFQQYSPFRDLGFHFQKEKDSINFNPDLISRVQFRKHNLVTEKAPGTFDLILCRNVMIYFDHAAKIKLLDRFYKALNPGGFLVIGFYDSLVPLLQKTEFHFYDKEAKIFQKQHSDFSAAQRSA